jgi:hypothetical protein
MLHSCVSVQDEILRVSTRQGLAVGQLHMSCQVSNAGFCHMLATVALHCTVCTLSTLQQHLYCPFGHLKDSSQQMHRAEPQPAYMCMFTEEASHLESPLQSTTLLTTQKTKQNTACVYLELSTNRMICSIQNKSDWHTDTSSSSTRCVTAPSKNTHQKVCRIGHLGT